MKGSATTSRLSTRKGCRVVARRFAPHDLDNNECPHFPGRIEATEKLCTTPFSSNERQGSRTTGEAIPVDRVVEILRKYNAVKK